MRQFVASVAKVAVKETPSSISLTSLQLVMMMICDNENKNKLNNSINNPKTSFSDVMRHTYHLSGVGNYKPLWNRYSLESPQSRSAVVVRRDNIMTA